jgi:hypothetical protein
LHATLEDTVQLRRNVEKTLELESGLLPEVENSLVAIIDNDEQLKLWLRSTIALSKNARLLPPSHTTPLPSIFMTFVLRTDLARREMTV